MKTEVFGKIKYGKLRFVFEFSESVRNFLEGKGISSELIFPKTQFFYQGVLMKLGINYEDEREVRVVFSSISFKDEGVKEIIEGDYEMFFNFPIHIGEDLYLIDFGVELK